MISFTVGIRTHNPLNGNQSKGWQGTHFRRVREREKVGLAWLVAARGRKPALPVVVTLTRLGRNRRPMDEDGLKASLKTVRDAVARHLGVDDGDKRIEFVCGQEYAKAYGVRIEVRETTP